MLALNAEGYLVSVTNPMGETHAMAYTREGLLTRFTDPEGHANRFEYDALGRLIKDTNAGEGGWTIARTGSLTRTYDSDFRVTGLSVNGRARDLRL